MQINQVHNVNFGNKWIKIQKPKNPKLLEGATTTGLGTASICTGLDSLNILPSTIVPIMADTTFSVCGESLANETATTFLASTPWGIANSCYGSSVLGKTLLDEKKNQRKIPS